MALYLESRHKSSSIKRAAIAVLASFVAAGTIVVALFALTTALALGAVVFLVGAIWWKLSGKKRFQAVTRQAFNAHAEFVRAPSVQGHTGQGHTGRIIEGEVVRRD